MLHSHSIPCSCALSSLDLHTLCNYKGRHGHAHTHTYKRHIVAVSSERTTLSSLFPIQCMWFMYAIKDSKYYLKRTNCGKEYTGVTSLPEIMSAVCVLLPFDTKVIQCCFDRKWCSFEVVIWLEVNFTAHTGLLNFGFPRASSIALKW